MALWILDEPRGYWLTLPLAVENPYPEKKMTAGLYKSLFREKMLKLIREEKNPKDLIERMLDLEVDKWPPENGTGACLPASQDPFG